LTTFFFIVHPYLRIAIFLLDKLISQAPKSIEAITGSIITISLLLREEEKAQVYPQEGDFFIILRLKLKA
jgi:hypothetical protein